MKFLIKTFVFSFSYITPLNRLPSDFLLKQSLSHHKAFNSYPSLLAHLKETNILKSPLIEKVLLKLPRNDFIKESSFIIKPDRLLEGQNMTDIAIQCEILQFIEGMLSFPLNTHINEYKMLDIGTGNGFMAFALYLMSFYNEKTAFIEGIDCYKTLIDLSRVNKERLSLPVSFEALDLKEFLLKSPNSPYKVINLGFGVEKEIIKALQRDFIEDKGFIIAPIIKSQDLQVLSCITKEKEFPLIEGVFFAKMLDLPNKSQLQRELKGLEDSLKNFVKDYRKEDITKGLKGLLEKKEVKEVLKEINKIKCDLKRTM